jgi:hypothetical protein
VTQKSPPNAPAVPASDHHPTPPPPDQPDILTRRQIDAAADRLRAIEERLGGQA